MFTIVVYLFYFLRLLILGGCNHIMHQHDMMHNGAQQSGNSDYSFIINKDGSNLIPSNMHWPPENEKRKLEFLLHIFKYTCNSEAYWFRNWITALLIQYATLSDKENKHEPKRPVALFRIYMNAILPHGINAHVNDGLIDKLLGHITAASRDKYAKACAGAIAGSIADMTIKILHSALDVSSLKRDTYDMRPL